MPAALERCVKEVKAKGKAKNAWAVCRASMGTDAQIAARARTRERPGSKPRRYA